MVEPTVPKSSRRAALASVIAPARSREGGEHASPGLPDPCREVTTRWRRTGGADQQSENSHLRELS